MITTRDESRTASSTSWVMKKIVFSRLHVRGDLPEAAPGLRIQRSKGSSIKRTSLFRDTAGDRHPLLHSAAERFRIAVLEAVRFTILMYARQGRVSLFRIAGTIGFRDELKAIFDVFPTVIQGKSAYC